MENYTRIIKRPINKIKSFKMRAKGYSIYQAHNWLSRVNASKKHSSLSSAQRKEAIRSGFTPLYASLHKIDKNNREQFLSELEYRYIAPVNGKYSKWVTDMVSARYVMKPYSAHLIKSFFHIYPRDGFLKMVAMPDCPEGYSENIEGVLSLIRDRKRTLICTAKWAKLGVVEWDGEFYNYNNKQLNRHEMIQVFARSGNYLVLCEEPEPHSSIASLPMNYKSFLRVVMINENGDDPRISDAWLLNGVRAKTLETSYEADNEEIPLSSVEELNDRLNIAVNVGDGSFCGARSQNGASLLEHSVFPNTDTPIKGIVPHWDMIKEQLDSLCRFLPQLEFFALDIIVTEEGFRIIKIFDFPPFPVLYTFSKETVEYVRKKYSSKKKTVDTPESRKHRSYLKVRSKRRQIFSRLCYPRGLVPYLSEFWLRDLRNDNKENKSCTPAQKRWAHKNGFISYRIEQYGITKKNREEFISDFEYRWLRHINNRYKYWLEDKITVKYIASDFSDCFPSYYYYTSLKNGAIKIIPMMDCPEGYSASYEDIFRLVREKGELALKPDEGSHGEGFYRFSYIDGKYYMNFQEVDEDFVRGVLSNVNNQYLVTEYIKMHPDLVKIYPGSVNTIRLIVFKKDGKTPVIGNAYMRIGSKKSGAVDNMGAGGMFAKIDIDTGRYFDPKICEHNEILPCECHPDTGVKIEGYLPNWDMVKEKVLAIAASINQIEYFGFDLAITEDGIKLPEINRFPDYPKIEKFSPKTIDYLLYKLERKKKLYGYDIERPIRLINLPKRGPYVDRFKEETK